MTSDLETVRHRLAMATATLNRVKETLTGVGATDLLPVIAAIDGARKLAAAYLPILDELQNRLQALPFSMDRREAVKHLGQAASVVSTAVAELDTALGMARRSSWAGEGDA